MANTKMGRRPDRTQEQVDADGRAYAAHVATRRIHRLTYSVLEGNGYVERELPLDAQVRFHFAGPEASDWVEVTADALAAGSSGPKSSGGFDAVEVRIGQGTAVVRPVSANVVRVGRAASGT